MDLDEKISLWLKDYLLNNGMDSFIVGVSGGIDSAVTSTLCALTEKKNCFGYYANLSKSK